mgnify:CR=1 FL=1|jgi:hypothetical protein
MNQVKRIQLNQSPKILSLYRRALFAKGSKGSAAKLPNTHITLANVKADRQKVSQYSEVCGFKQNNNQLPITFPHILAFPLHLELMLLKDFPFAVMGMVHIRNEITQFRAIKLSEQMDVSCHFSDIRTTDKGYDIDIKTEIHITGELVWESISTNLVRKKTNIAPIPKITAASPPELPYKEFWNLSSDLGLRYARISGDSNPIHLFSLSAKLFGFKGHIAHGMWTKARVAAALYNKLDTEACKIVVDFKLPIFLPTTIQLNYQLTDAIVSFEVRDKDGVKPHMKGDISAL